LCCILLKTFMYFGSNILTGYKNLHSSYIALLLEDYNYCIHWALNGEIMRIQLAGSIGLLLVIMLPGAISYTFDETITVSGGGDLSASTNIPQARDYAQGIGDHTYHREIESNATSSLLMSSYSFNATPTTKGRGPQSLLQKLGLDLKPSYKLTAPIMLNYNKYSIVMNNERGKLLHALSGSWLEDFESNNSVFNGKNNLATSFAVNGNGVLSEAVVNLGDKHNRMAASASVNGNFVLKSNLAEVIKPELDDYQILSGKADDIKANVSIDEARSNARRAQIARDKTMQTNYTSPEKGTVQTDNLSSLVLNPDKAGKNCTPVKDANGIWVEVCDEKGTELPKNETIEK